MTENEQIVIDTIESLKRNLYQMGSLTIGGILFESIEMTENEEEEEELLCSYISTEFDEGIYYHESTHRFFYYGEPPVFSKGGRKWVVVISGDMLDLIPPMLPELLMEVARTGIPVTMPFNGLLDDAKN
jgi:hypothetical protein